MALSVELLTMLNYSEESLCSELKNAVSDIFITMVGLEDLAHLPGDVTEAPQFVDCITSLVGLEGRCSGMVSLHMPGSLAVKTAECMLEIGMVDHYDVNDALGELANMIAGSFKSNLLHGGFGAQHSIPSVVHGTEFVSSLFQADNRITVGFGAEQERFMVTVAFV